MIHPPVYVVGFLRAINPQGLPIVYQSQGRSAVVLLKDEMAARKQCQRAGSGHDVFPCRTTGDMLRTVELGRRGGAREVLLDAETTEDGCLVWNSGIPIDESIEQMRTMIAKEGQAEHN